MNENILQYLFVFCTKYKKMLLTEDLHADFLNLTYKYCYENSLELLSLNIRDKNTVIIEIKTEVGTESPHVIVTNLKSYVAGELKKKYPQLKSKTPSLWTREHFIQTIGTRQDDIMEMFIQTQKGLKD
jgi:putative transposase